MCLAGVVGGGRCVARSRRHRTHSRGDAGRSSLRLRLRAVHRARQSAGGVAGDGDDGGAGSAVLRRRAQQGTEGGLCGIIGIDQGVVQGGHSIDQRVHSIRYLDPSIVNRRILCK